MRTTGDVLEFAKSISRVSAQVASAAVEGERGYTHPYLHAIFSAYDRAIKDEKAVIPTVLHAAIENARRALGDCAPPASAFEERRKYPRDGDTELSVDGRRIRPGQ